MPRQATKHGVPPLHPIERRVARTLEAARLPANTGPLLAAVSGGPDSTALLVALAALREPAGHHQQVHAVHIDHGLRSGSVQDAAYVRRLAARLGMQATVIKVDVRAALRARKLSLEDASRQARYGALARAAAQMSAAAVLVAHNADDQAETVMLALMRGAGLRGLAGMQERDALPPTPGGPPASGVPLLRPLLTISRAEIEDYLRERRLRPRRDPSNASPDFLRNRVRQELLPLMERMRPGSGEAVRRAGTAAAEALDFLNGCVDRAWADAARLQDEVVSLRSQAFAALHPALQTLVLQRAVEQTAGTLDEFTARHWNAMRHTVESGRPGSSLHLPQGLRLTSLYGEATLSRGDPPCPLPVVEEGPLRSAEGKTAGRWRFEIQPAGDGCARITAMATNADEEAAPPLPGPLSLLIESERAPHLLVKRRAPGDRIRLPRGTRKLQDVFTDARVPRSWRDNIPVIMDARSGEIVWAVGVAVAAAGGNTSPET